MKPKLYIGVDPGFKGGISVVEEGKSPIVYNMPVIISMVKNKKKTKYDIDAIVDIFKAYGNRKATFTLERVSVRPGEGGCSAFNFGEGFGTLKGIAVALGYELIIVSPVTWKKAFPKLESKEMTDIRFKIKLLESNNKIEKDNDKKKLNKKEIEKEQRSLKALAKTQARLLAQEMYPDLSKRFDRKLDDGVAESLLIALYARSV